MTNEFHVKIDNEEEFVKWMNNLVIPQVMENYNKSGDYVWIAVPAGERKAYLKSIRAYLKYSGIQSNIERILKVVEEETLED